jgi:hypothetical protein
MKSLNETSPTIVSHDMASVQEQHDFAGSVEPIGIVPDSPSVPSGGQFSLNLTLSAPPASFSTVGVYIMPAVAAGSAPAPAAGTADVSVHFSNLDVHVHATGQGVAASAVSTHLVVPLQANQIQQHIHLPAPIVTTPTQYIVSVLGHNQNNIPTSGVSTTITVHP